jgi:hypothetical protein
MKQLLTAFLLLPALTGWAQQTTITKTDSSRIESRVYPAGRQVKEVMNKKDLVYRRFYRDNQTKATSSYTTTKAGRIIGVEKEYDDQGRLQYSIDHDRGRLWFTNKQVDPYARLRQQMKARADGLIVALYGQEFLTKNTIWNVETSSLYGYPNGAGANWTADLHKYPTFLFRYNVRLDREHIYPELIVFELDALGHFIPDKYSRDEAYGFEKLASSPAHGFGLDYRKALTLVKEKSGVRDHLTGALHWEGDKKGVLYTGRFRFYVSVKTDSVKVLHPQGRSRITYYYDVYSFNPWTGAFVERKKMEAVREWEARSGFSTGLRPRR